MAEVYRSKVAALNEALSCSDADGEATEAIRSLVEKVVLLPKNGKLVIDFYYGEIGPILNLAMAQKSRDVPGPVSEQ